MVLRLWDMATGQLLRTFAGHGDWIMGLGFTPDGSRVLSASGARFTSYWQNGHDFDVRVWDTKSGQLLARWAGHTAMVFMLRVSPDGRLALTASADGTRFRGSGTWQPAGRFAGSPVGEKSAWTPSSRPTVSACSCPRMATLCASLTCRMATR